MEPSARSKILVLDDNDAFRRIMVRSLVSAGYAVVDSANADETLTILDGAAEFDLLITDITMPKFQPNGIAVGKMAMMKRRGLKVIFIAGDPGQVPQGFIDTAETPLISKPIRMKEFLAVVKSVLERGASRVPL